MPLVSWKLCLLSGLLSGNYATAFISSKYELTHEYSGTNFFDGWDFYSGRDPTGGFVTYYTRSSAQLTGLISSSESGPAYMGVNYVDKLPFNNQTGRGDGAGRPSVRIASKEAFTHGLFVGDFDHIPAGNCGTWPAFWTLGPNWPYTGEIDIMEGVNQNTKNVMSLHTNETCIIQGNSTYMTGELENTNCAYYPDYNVGCGVSDPRPTSFGVGFNQAGGGVYAMQWTSEYIRIWHWARSNVPSDLNGKQPDPSSWGLPAAELAVGNCSVDQHFQSHKIIFDTTFCGEYAGNPYVWKTNDENSCADSTGLATCDNFVANNPAAFKDAYWSVNYVRVYELVDPQNDATGTAYIASEQPTNAATNAYTAENAVATPNIDVDSLCPQYNFSIITDGKYQYEIACDFDPPGPDIGADPYPGFKANSLADCLKGCTYMNENNGTNKCGGVAHFAAINFCYFKKYIDGNLNYRPGYNQIRLIYYGYPQITDDPRSVADSTLTSSFIETIPTPQTYRASTITGTTTTTAVITTTSTTSKSTTIGAPPMGGNSTSATIPPDYSETVTSGYTDATRTESATSLTTSSVVTRTESMTATPVASTDPSVTSSDFYIVFNVNVAPGRLSKRDVQYLAFDSQGQSILVADQEQATKFKLGPGAVLMNGDQYVAIDSSVQPPRFSLSVDIPDTPTNVEIDDNGNVVVQGVNGYCFTLDGQLAVNTDTGDLPENCVSVDPQLTAAPSDSSSTSSTMETTTSTISMTSVGGSPTTRSTARISSPLSDDSTIVFTSSPSQSSSIVSDSSSAQTSISVTGIFSSPSSASTSSFTTESSGSILSSLTRTSSSTTLIPTPSNLNNFIFAGCFGVSLSSPSPADIPTPFSDPAMTNDLCTKHCGEQAAYFAGTSGVNCFCASSQSLYASLVEFPDASCNMPCPGANRDFCGGEAGFQDAVPTTSLALPRRGVRMDRQKRQDVIFLISLYNNTLLLGGGTGGSDVPTTTNTGSGTATETVTTGPTGTSLSFPPDAISYNTTGTNTATVISTTYVDVCHVCPGGLTTKATTITVPHCGCTASYDAGLGHSVNVPSPVVPMLTTTKNCACGHGGAASTITVTVPHSSSIALLSSQLPSVPPAMPMPMPMGGAAGEPGNVGAMPSPAPADVGGSAGSAPYTMDEPESLDQDSSTPNHAANASDTNMEGGLVSPEVNNDDEDDEDEDFGPSTNTVPLTALAVPSGNPNFANAAIAAPASSPVLSGASNTAIPVGISNYTAPAATPGIPSNGSFTGFNPVAPFTSGASASVSVSHWVSDKFTISLLCGIVLCCLVAGW